MSIHKISHKYFEYTIKYWHPELWNPKVDSFPDNATLLMRHSNRFDITACNPHPKLTEEGKIYAHTFHEKGFFPKNMMVISSPSDRTRETGQLAAGLPAKADVIARDELKSSKCCCFCHIMKASKIEELICMIEEYQPSGEFILACTHDWVILNVLHELGEENIRREEIGFCHGLMIIKESTV